jgi:hypothetical protein
MLPVPAMSKPVSSVMSTPSGVPSVRVPAFGGFWTNSWSEVESTPKSVVVAGFAAVRAELA